MPARPATRSQVSTEMKANASKDVVEPRGWHSRGYLPHSTVARSRSSSPFGWVIHCRRPCSIGGGKNCKEKRALTSRQPCAVALKRISIKVTAGVYLKEERVATMVQNSLLFHDGERYRLSSWVVCRIIFIFWRRPVRGLSFRKFNIR